MERIIFQMLEIVLPLTGFACPVFELFLGNVFLHFLQFSLIGKNDHHGSIAKVRQIDKGAVLGYVDTVLLILRLHHVHSDLCVLIHVEVSFVGGCR